jgi:hypothetical protein
MLITMTGIEARPIRNHIHDMNLKRSQGNEVDDYMSALLDVQ